MAAGATTLTPQSKLVAMKSVSFRFSSSQDLAFLFEGFRLMCNDAIRIAIQNEPNNRFELVRLAYPRLKEFGLHTHYILSACEVAYAAYRNQVRKSAPYIKKAFLKLDSQSYQLNHSLLRIPITPRNFIFLTLHSSDYHTSFIDNPSLKRGSVTITDKTVSIAFSKNVEQINPTGFIGIDVNERNATASGTDGYYNKFEELGDVVEIKERYRGIRRKISQMTGGDRRIANKLLRKYGNKEKDRTTSRIHKVTSQIVDYAREHRLGIKMENLKDIRKKYRRGNGQGVSFRGRMNTWVFGETQRQVDYKAKWDGVSDRFVNPRGTSSYCLCGSRIAHLADRKVYCPWCDIVWDRDDLASKNIMACVVPQARPSRGSSEGGRGNDGSNPLSRWRVAKTNGSGPKG
jgi:putative transposase